MANRRRQDDIYYCIVRGRLPRSNTASGKCMIDQILHPRRGHVFFFLVLPRTTTTRLAACRRATRDRQGGAPPKCQSQWAVHSLTRWAWHWAAAGLSPHSPQPAADNGAPPPPPSSSNTPLPPSLPPVRPHRDRAPYYPRLAFHRPVWVPLTRYPLVVVVVAALQTGNGLGTPLLMASRGVMEAPRRCSQPRRRR